MTPYRLGEFFFLKGGGYAENIGSGGGPPLLSDRQEIIFLLSTVHGLPLRGYKFESCCIGGGPSIERERERGTNGRICLIECGRGGGR